MRHLEIVRRLQSPNYLHSFIATDAEGPVANELDERGIEVVRVGAVRTPLAPSRYVTGFSLARRWNPDIIHGAVMEGNVLAAAVGRLRGVPTIVEETSDPQNRAPWGHRLAKLVYASATRCVGVSASVGCYLTDDLGVPARKVSVIANGVRSPVMPSAKGRAAIRASLGIAGDAIVIGTVSRLFNDHKRVTDLIEAHSVIAQRLPQVHLIVVGTGPDLELMRQVAAEGGHPDRVHFVGQQIPADNYYAVMDIFALASVREAFGLVAAEAMRAGLPVVATRVGGLAGVVSEGDTGVLVSPRNVPELAAALQVLVLDPASRLRMGVRGRRRADLEFSAERYVADVAQLYDEVLRASAVRRSR